MSDRYQRISERAYLIWVDEGRPEGREFVHWLIAEQEFGDVQVVEVVSVTTSEALDGAPDGALADRRGSERGVAESPQEPGRGEATAPQTESSETRASQTGAAPKKRTPKAASPADAAPPAPTTTEAAAPARNGRSGGAEKSKKPSRGSSSGKPPSRGTGDGPKTQGRSGGGK
jgi:hypothetical protein